MEERRENIMGTQPINRLLPSMAFPIMLSMLVQALYNVVDSVFVSMVSENALTSVSLAFPVQNLMIAVSVGTAVGINALLSRRLGEKNFEAANKVAENGIFVTVLSWAVFAVFGAACSGLFMGAFTQNAEILAGGTDYMWIVTVFSLGLFMSVTMERVLQVTGKTVYQMISQMTGAVVNIILDPVFIFGWLGLPAMGVARAAQWAGPQAAGQLPGMVYKMWRPPRKMRFGMLCGWKTAWPKPPERRRETDQARARPHKRWRPAAAPFRAGGTRHDTNHTGAAHWCRSFRWNQETQEYVPIPTDMRSLNWRFLANRIHKQRRGKG